MSLVLDTNILFELERDDKGVISAVAELKAKHPGRICITSLNYCEVYHGALDRGERSRRETLDYLDSFGLLNTTRGSAIRLAELRKSQKAKGAEVPVMDLLIASIVIDRGMTLVTRDKHFEGVEGLKVVVV